MMTDGPIARAEVVQPHTESIAPDVALPSVTVVICCFNQGHFLAEAIQSAVKQTWANLEVIVVDDGSTDKTQGVAASIPEVVYLRQTNGGLASARNLGLAAAKGALVCFLDADDRLLPGAIEAGVAAMRANPTCAFVAGRYRLTDRAFRELAGEAVPRPDGASYTDLLRHNFIAMHATVLFRRATLIECSGFDPSLAAAEDYDVYLRLAVHRPFALHDEIVADYRHHGANMTLDAGRMLVATVAVMEKQRPFVAGDAFKEAALEAGLAGYRSAYGRALLRQAGQRILRPKEWPTAGKEIMLTAMWAPRGFASAIAAFATWPWRHHSRPPNKNLIASDDARESS